MAKGNAKTAVEAVETKQAYALGQAALAKGIYAACQDAALMAMIPSGTPVGSGVVLSLLTAWNRGLTFARLNAPVEE